MRYAIIENGLVANLIWLMPSNVSDFHGAVCVDGRPVAIGDAYTDGIFTRNGEPVLTDAERIAELETALAEIEEAIIHG